MYVEHRCSTVVLILSRVSRNKVEPLSPIGMCLVSLEGYGWGVVESRWCLVRGTSVGEE